LAGQRKQGQNSGASQKPRILFIGEAVSLAHIARPAVLAQALNPDYYQICFACDQRFDSLFTDTHYERRSIYSISSNSFLRALAKGKPIYTRTTLNRYVKEDLQLIKSWRPQVIIGDFRLSLAISTRIAGIPYVNISNTYWSPYAKQQYPLPEHIMARILGINIAQKLFRLLRPVIFASHTLPINLTCRAWRQPLLGLNLRRAYTEADYVVYADVPNSIETPNLPSNHHFLGPILWSPQQTLPDWWHDLPSRPPTIYLTPGSSGDNNLLDKTLTALAGMNVSVMVATAGQKISVPIPKNAYLSNYLPGIEAAQRADLVICNGGSPTTQQALAAGKPVIGICSNLDQYLNMQSVERSGAGRLLRAGKVSPATIRTTVETLLQNTSYRQAAENTAKLYQQYNAGVRFQELINAIV